MKPILLILALATPAFAGGPVVVEDAFVQEARPSSEGRWVVPVIVGLLIIGALAGGDEPGKPVDPCNGEGC